MPEIREIHAQKYHLRKSIALNQSHNLTVHNILADATNEEAELPDAHPRAKKHLVHSIDASCQYVRGSSGVQSPIFPPMYTSTTSLSKLKLLGPESIQATNRTILLDFQDLIFSVSRFNILEKKYRKLIKLYFVDKITQTYISSSTLR